MQVYNIHEQSIAQVYFAFFNLVDEPFLYIIKVNF